MTNKSVVTAAMKNAGYYYDFATATLYMTAEFEKNSNAYGTNEYHLMNRIEKLDDWTSFIRFRLNINCRNTKPICREIETVTSFKAPSANWTQVDGPPVQYITWKDEDEQQEKLTELLQSLLDSQVYPEHITIISPRKWEDSVASKVEGFGIKKYHVQHGMHVTFCTIQGFKGLENTVIIVTDVEDYSSDKLMYIGLSRATSGLYVLESERAKQEYDALMLRRLIQ